MALKKYISNKFLGLILLLCISRVCYGQLMCYVCDNCVQVNMQTPLLECNEDFFNAGGPTDSSVQTTTENSESTTSITTQTTSKDETTPTTIHTVDTTMITTTTTTESKSSESTTKVPIENVTETSTETITQATTPNVTETIHQTTSEEQLPSTSTSAPISSTPYILKPLDDVEKLNNKTVAHEQNVNKDEVENIDIQNGTAKPYKPSAEFRVRQLRSVSNVTFNCFKVEATTANGKIVVNRGCARVQAGESVCGQWRANHSEDKMNKCYPCSRTKCNGSSALNVSFTALFIAVIAVFMHRK